MAKDSEQFKLAWSQLSDDARKRYHAEREPFRLANDMVAMRALRQLVLNGQWQ